MTLLPPDKARILAYQRETVQRLHRMEAIHHPEPIPPEELRLILERINMCRTMWRLAKEGFCLQCQLPWDGHPRDAVGEPICIVLAIQKVIP